MAIQHLTKLRCGFYGRMSTNEQEHSIDSQTILCDSWADASESDIVDRYIDAGIAGDLTADKRPEFQRMLTDAKAGRFDAVLIRDPSRLSRSNSIKGSRELEPLFDAKVIIVTASGLRMDLSDMAGRIQLQLWFEMSHADNRNRGLAVANGMLRAAQNASWIGGRPMGYEITGAKGKKRLVVGDAYEIRLVRRIFRLYDKGATIEEIARRLEADNVRTITGKPHWNRGTIAGILKNPAYVGDFAFCKNAYGKYHAVVKSGIANADGKRHKNGKSEWILIPDVHPAIIEREQFDRVQNRIGQNKSYPNNRTAFLLSSRLRCAECDEPMHGRTMRSGNRQYECAGCHATANEGKTVDAITAAIGRYFDADRVEAELRRLVQPNGPKGNQKERRRLQRDLERQRRKLVMLDDDPELVELVKTDINRIRAELEDLDDGDRARTHSIDSERRVRSALSKLADLPKALLKASDASARTFLQEAVACVQVRTRTTGSLRKRYHLTGGEIFLNVDQNNTGVLVRENPDLTG